MQALRRFASLAVAAATVAAPALSTWSIVVVNTRTREVCVAGATCLENLNLRKALPVVRPGLGGGVSQAAIDNTGANRAVIWNGLGQGLSPAQILAQLQTNASHPSRQFGIVDFDDAPVTYSGAQTSAANPGVAATVGEYRYAIQGNILTGNEVVLYAEQAFLTTPGDLGQKVLAAMEAARFWGGDGRCSCSPSAPTSCALPPPPPFKSAHVGFFIVARVGDTGGFMCNSSAGCAQGTFYCALNIIGDGSAPDPVVTMQQQYAQWRGALAGRPDHVLTQVLPGARALVADRRSETEVTVWLHDVENVPLASGGATLTLTNTSGAPNVTVPSTVIDNGDGSYRFSLRAGALAGEDRWRIVVNDGVSPVTLWPELAIRVDPLAPLHVGYDELSVAEPHAVPITINAGALARRPTYLLLASNAGTSPGMPFAGTTLPLNPSALLTYTYTHANSAVLTRTFGTLDRNGRAVALFVPDSNLLAQLAGTRVEWSAVLFHPSVSVALAPVGFDVLP